MSKAVSLELNVAYGLSGYPSLMFQVKNFHKVAADRFKTSDFSVGLCFLCFFLPQHVIPPTTSTYRLARRPSHHVRRRPCSSHSLWPRLGRKLYETRRSSLS